MAIDITKKGLEERKEKSLEEMVERFKKEEIPREEAISNVSGAYTLLERACKDLPTEEAVQCLTIANNAKSKWEREMRG